MTSMRAALCLGIALIVLSTCAFAHDTEHYYALPEDEKQWLDTLMQPDNPGSRCCGESDAYWADSFKAKGDQYVAIITDLRDVPGRPHIPPGTEILVPNYKLKIDAGNPTGHGILFVAYDGENESFGVLCYVVPGGG